MGCVTWIHSTATITTFDYLCHSFFCTPTGKVRYYIPVSHDMMRQTNDCSPGRVMQHKVMYFLYLSQKILVDPALGPAALGLG